ncbi:MAG: FHA domain-containing protein [Rudaea sp.]
MRLSFPNNESADVLVAHGDNAIGAAADNAIVLNVPGIAAHHVNLVVSERSVVLNVLDSNGRTHVNARPVRAKAILRLGDVVSLDTVQFVLKPDSDDSIRTKVPAPLPKDNSTNPSDPSAPARLVLRGVSGNYFGKIVPVFGQLTVGSGNDCGLVLDENQAGGKHALVEVVGEAIYLRDLGSANGTSVNGVRVRDAVLYPDDQIGFDQDRFLLEAPGLPQRGQAADNAEFAEPVASITQTMRAIPKPSAGAQAPAPEPVAQRNDIWWLIGVAALIGIGLAVLFFAKY